MTIDDLRGRYGRKKKHKILTLAVRAEIPGGNDLVDFVTLLHERIVKRDIPLEIRVIIDLVYDHCDTALAMAKNHICAIHGLDQEEIDYTPHKPAQVGLPPWCDPLRFALSELLLQNIGDNAKSRDFAIFLFRRLELILKQITTNASGLG